MASIKTSGRVIAASAPAYPRSEAAWEVKSGSVLPDSNGAATPRSVRKSVATWACLVLSEDQQRLQSVCEIAGKAGWDPIGCQSVGEAIRETDRWRTQLSVIDLGSMSNVQKAAYMQFAERVASGERLLMICDEPGSENAGELWSRQAGAWLYLPSPEFTDGFVQLLRDARGIAEKIAGDSTAGV